VKKLAVIVTRGAYNNILQACEFARIAATSGTQVTMFFRDEAALRMSVSRANDLSLSDAYRGRDSRVRELLKERKQHDLQVLLRELKERGDVKLSVCRDSLKLFEVPVDHVISELDEVQEADAFWKEAVVSADHILTF